MEKRAGVYEIEIAGYKYYGSSININARKQSHISKLRSGKHRNQRLQRCFDKYGEDAMSFKILVVCDEESVLDEEQKYLDENIGNDNCLNFCRSASAPMAGISFNKEHKDKLRESNLKYKYEFWFNDGLVYIATCLTDCEKYLKCGKKKISRWFTKRGISSNSCHAKKIGITKIVRECLSSGEVVIKTTESKTKIPIWKLHNAPSKSQYYKNRDKYTITA